MGIIVHILITTVLLFILGRVVGGIEVRDGKAALFGAIGLGLANAFVRPLLIMLSLPITLITLGLFLIVINALMLMLAAAFVDGFEVEDFGSAVVGAIGLSVMNWLVGMLRGCRDERPPRASAGPPPPRLVSAAHGASGPRHCAAARRPPGVSPPEVVSRGRRGCRSITPSKAGTRTV
jgi:putative membrane protein